MYNAEEFSNEVSNFQEIAKELLLKKNNDYSKHSHTFEIINSIARSLHVQPVKVLVILFMKQVSALETYAVHGSLHDENIESRLYDIANYAFLIWYKIKLERLTNEDSSS